MKKLPLIFTLFFFLTNVCAQDFSNIRRKVVVNQGDTMVVDTLSIVPNSTVARRTNGEKLSKNTYHLEEMASKFYVVNGMIGDTIILNYRVFPINLSAPVANKDTIIIQKNLLEENPFAYKIQKKQSLQIFDESTLQRNGSISRGMVLGNKQNLSINSDFNLQLSGKLSDRINILANISDDNIPIQAEGNTQQLQEFDNVFIKLYDDKSNLVAGDFIMDHTQGRFLRYNKKARGINYRYQSKEPSDSSGFFSVGASAAVSKGKFSKNTFRGIEGNQGPYRLKGAGNEIFIIVLSGTERVFVDGKLLSRGVDADYVIDYNAAELTFTPNVLVTKDLRISVEFQYSDKNFARSVITASTMRVQSKSRLSINFYSEQDSKNQSLQQDLSVDDKGMLALIGDDLDAAIVPSIDTVAYSNALVLYHLTDSLGYDSVFVYQQEVGTTNYHLRFSYVGSHKGDYVQDGFTPNGRKFRWVAPDTISGAIVRQGDYLPVRKLVTPKKRQFLSVRQEVYTDNQDVFYLEGSVSNRDNNTFSSLNDDDNIGLGVNIGGVKKVKLNERSQLQILVDHEYRQKQLVAIERYRDVEFNINWNYRTVDPLGDQNLSKLGLRVLNKNGNFIRWDFGSLLEGNNYSGYRNSLSLQWKRQKTKFKTSASLLDTKGEEHTRFVIQNAEWTRNFSGWKLGVKDEYRSNEQFLGSDSLSNTSYEFIDGEVFVANKDSADHNYKFFYKQRLDKKSNEISLRDVNLSRIYGVQFQGKLHENHFLDMVISNRNLLVIDTLLSSEKAEDTFLGKINYRGKALRKGLSFSSYYDISSGLEPKKEFVFIQVPVGQGVYVWVDYNENGIKELAEFEIAKFQYEADYIRTFTLTNEFQKIYANSFSQSVEINPSIWWADTTGVLKFASRFNNITSISIARKTSMEEVKTAFNPFLKNIGDSALINLNSSIREVLFFNKNNLKWGLDFTYAELASKQLLSNGFEARRSVSRKVNARWNLSRSLRWDQSLEDGQKVSAADYSSTRSYDIQYLALNSTIQYQPGKKYRLKLKGEWKKKENISLELTNEIAFIQSVGIEGRVSQVGKGNLQAGIQYINIAYNGTGTNSLTFEMLDGLAVGTNFTWNMLLQRTLMENLELNFSYNGRVGQGKDAIHSGGMQIRAFF